MRSESKVLEKTMQNRHMCVSSFVDDKLETKSDNAQQPKQIEGYLFKRTSKGFKTWNRRWFYLCDNQLVYKWVKWEDVLSQRSPIKLLNLKKKIIENEVTETFQLWWRKIYVYARCDQLMIQIDDFVSKSYHPQSLCSF